MNRGRGGRGRGRGRGNRRGRGRGGRGGRGAEISENPNLLGHIYFNNINVSEYLIEHGLASVIRRRYDQSGLISQQKRGGPPKKFIDLEDKARKHDIGVWKENNRQYNEMNESDQKASEERAKQLAKNDKTGKEINVVVSHIESATLFYVNDADNDKMVGMNQSMVELKKSAKMPARITARKHYAALYDGFYARARVNNLDDRDKRRQQQKQQNDNQQQQCWFVMFIDYGNRASIAKKQFAVLPAELRTDKIAPLAMRCVLAGIRSADKKDPCYYEAGTFFSRQVMQQKLKMKILYDDQLSRTRTWYVDLFVGEQSINQLLVKEGFLRIEKYQSEEFKGKYCDDYFKELQSNTQEALREHKNIFVHGDIDSGDEDNLGPFGAATGTGRRR
eukprot:68528_1